MREAPPTFEQGSSRACSAPTPLAVFAYNRPEHLDRALAALAACSRIDGCRVYVYCDGPRGTGDADAVTQTRQVARRWAARLGAVVRERTANFGLAKSIVGGVTDLCEDYGRAIVVEDDLEVGSDFIAFMLDALDRYERAGTVYQISGYMFPVAHPSRPDAFFLPLTTTWGWATWQRAWRAFDWDTGDALERLQDPALRHRFDIDGSYPYADMLKARLAGRNDSWGILWWWAVFKAAGVVLHPRRSLVSVGGFDGSGTHCGRAGGDDAMCRSETLAFRFNEPVTFPERVQADTDALERVRQFLSPSAPMAEPVGVPA